MAHWPYNTSAWQRLRAAKLAVNPVCEVCERRGLTVLADTVDHILAIAAGGDAFPALDQLMSMCTRCHGEKTSAMDRPDRSASGRKFKGCDVDGNPIDPDDGWFQPGALAGPSATAAGPTPQSSSDLVLCEPFATRKMEGQLWD